MENNNKQPQVFVARKLTSFINNIETTIAYYVSKANLQTFSITYLDNGEVYKDYLVCFDGNEYHMANSENIYAENECGVERYVAFVSFDECKKYVDKVNKALLVKSVEAEEDCVRAKDIIEQHIKAKEIGERLENEYISEEDRKNPSENILIF